MAASLSASRFSSSIFFLLSCTRICVFLAASSASRRNFWTSIWSMRFYFCSTANFMRSKTDVTTIGFSHSIILSCLKSFFVSMSLDSLLSTWTIFFLCLAGFVPKEPADSLVILADCLYFEVFLDQSPASVFDFRSILVGVYGPNSTLLYVSLHIFKSCLPACFWSYISVSFLVRSGRWPKSMLSSSTITSGRTMHLVYYTGWLSCNSSLDASEPVFSESSILNMMSSCFCCYSDESMLLSSIISIY